MIREEYEDKRGKIYDKYLNDIEELYIKIKILRDDMEKDLKKLFEKQYPKLLSLVIEMKKWKCQYHGCNELNDKGDGCNHPIKEELWCYQESLS